MVARQLWTRFMHGKSLMLSCIASLPLCPETKRAGRRPRSTSKKSEQFRCDHSGKCSWIWNEMFRIKLRQNARTLQ